MGGRCMFARLRDRHAGRCSGCEDLLDGTPCTGASPVPLLHGGEQLPLDAFHERGSGGSSFEELSSPPQNNELKKTNDHSHDLGK